MAQPGASGARLERVFFQLSTSSWHPYRSEQLWAEPLHPGKYRLRNVPFIVLGYSLGDVVSATREGERLVVRGPILRSGHSTYRLFFDPSVGWWDRGVQRGWAKLARLGCSVEHASEWHVALDVPARSDLDAVLLLLEEGFRRGTWFYEEGHRGHLGHD